MPVHTDAPVDLRGFTVGVTADRRGDEQALLLRRLGVDVVLGPAMRTLAVADGGDLLRTQVEAILASPPDYLVANTGIGVRNLFALATGWGLDEKLRSALVGVRIVARGPKAAGALRLAGLPVWWRAPSEQLAEVHDHLLAEGVAGSRLVFQLHGDDRQGFTAAMRRAGAEVTEIEVYRWSLPADLSGALELVEGCCAGRIDAITFTAAPAVRNLVDVADTAGRAGELVDALNHEVIVACVGPVCAAAALEEGLTSPVVPEHWRLGSLVKEVGTALAWRRRHLRVVSDTGLLDVIVQGSLLLVDGVEVHLDGLERSVARILAEVPDTEISAVSLEGRVGRDSRGPAAGPGRIKAGVERLRDKLGPAGASLAEPSPGSYRWEAELVEGPKPGPSGG